MKILFPIALLSLISCVLFADDQDEQILVNSKLQSATRSFMVQKTEYIEGRGYFCYLSLTVAREKFRFFIVSGREIPDCDTPQYSPDLCYLEVLKDGEWVKAYDVHLGGYWPHMDHFIPSLDSRIIFRLPSAMALRELFKIEEASFHVLARISIEIEAVAEDKIESGKVYSTPLIIEVEGTYIKEPDLSLSDHPMLRFNIGTQEQYEEILSPYAETFKLEQDAALNADKPH